MTVKDLADAEAARAESEQDDEPVTAPEEGAAPGDEDEQAEALEQEEAANAPEQPEPSEQSSETKVEDKGKLLASAHKSWSTRLATVMGDDLGYLQPCPLCWEQTQGLVWPGMPYDEDRKQAVKIVLGEYGADQYQEDPARVQCPVCLGRGMLKTGSLVQGQDALNCRACQGNGWQYKPGENQPANGSGEPIWTTSPPHAVSAPAPPPDQWGRPFGHPDFGKAPALVNSGGVT